MSKHSHRLSAYLNSAAGLGFVACSAEGAIVNLDVSSISGVNAGLPNASWINIDLSTLGDGLEGHFDLYNRHNANGVKTGFAPSTTMFAAGTGTASPINFPAGELIDSSDPFSTAKYRTVFANNATVAPDFGPDSFVGFKSQNGHYGWFEVTWDSSAGDFEILSGAFENVAGVGIQAGATAAVPEPAGVLGTIGLLAGGAFVRRRQRVV
jgi:hypothetical protein